MHESLAVAGLRKKALKNLSHGALSSEIDEVRNKSSVEERNVDDSMPGYSYFAVAQ